MEATKIPLSQCIESKHQNRKDLGDVSEHACSIEVNGQITPLIVVADGETYQLVAGHRQMAAMRKLGLAEADAYVTDGWDDARIAQVLNAENNHRKELDQFVPMRTVPECMSCLSSHILKEGYRPWAYDVDDLLSFARTAACGPCPSSKFLALSPHFSHLAL